MLFFKGKTWAASWKNLLEFFFGGHMNKVLVVSVVMGGLALGGIFFVAGIFTGISVSLKEGKGAAASEHWPPKTLKSSNSPAEKEGSASGGGVL
ncbi:MAG: hypothetical protein LBD66_02375, partial [Holosporales bacterium]|nr:hypothetical protein [Holosporales bacterium]